MGRNRMHKAITPVFLILVAAGMSLADGLQDLHLDVAPRTGTDTAWIAKVTAATQDFTVPETFEQNPGGDATIPDQTGRDAFSQPSANLSFEQELDFKVGNELFSKIWTPSDGLGPLYNAGSCLSCHIRDGRGHPPAGPMDDVVSMFLRVSIPGGMGIPGTEADMDTKGDPTYGKQLQDFAQPGHLAEYRLQVTYQTREVLLGDGEIVQLQVPTYFAADLGYGALHKDAVLSPRVAPQMIGLGLLEAIPAADILAGADEGDTDGDGISGRANIVWSKEFDRPMLGRFGLKAEVPTVYHQSAAAFADDMGLSNPLFPDPWGECTAQQSDCREALQGDGDAQPPEIDDTAMDLVAFYSRTLAVPGRRDLDDGQVLRGKELFYQTGCTACHTPKFVTHRLNDRAEHSFQLIWPYSDMLLHDMGEGLADQRVGSRPDARATGAEWRTPPLWGIGLTKAVSGHTRFLHDGRARNLLEAILWHGGEAELAKVRFMSMPKQDRDALIRFLESL
ncbi:MAG: c-type cytochrome [Rhodobacteraceae bacterium]|nr:c-type cytochrome [Paracoccaceae bacterium]